MSISVLLAQNNLSDLDDPAEALVNLAGGAPANGLTAFAGGGQGSAVPLTKSINRVTTVATAGDSVKLPAAIAGKSIVVINAAVSNAMDCFPDTGEIINALSANAALSIDAGSVVQFFCAVTGTWNALVSA